MGEGCEIFEGVAAEHKKNEKFHKVDEMEGMHFKQRLKNSLMM